MINDTSSDENEEFKKIKYVKKIIPKALREQVWINTIGKKFSSKCTISWCTNTITPFDYHCAHIIPESKNGQTTIENLVPTCSKCNLSMSSTGQLKCFDFKYAVPRTSKSTMLEMLSVTRWLSNIDESVEPRLSKHILI